MWEKIKRLFRSSRSWRRWSPEELEHRKRVLEAKDPEKLDAEHWVQIAEWMAQRYMPEEERLNEVEFQRAMRTWRDKIEERMRNPLPPRLVPAKVSTADYSDFEANIIPVLRKNGVIPRQFVDANEREFLADLFRECGDQQASVWHQQSFMQDKYATENLDFQRVAVSTSSAINAYNYLLDAKQRDKVTVRGIAPDRETCEIARNLIADKEYSIDRLLDAYDDPDGPVPILPHPRCQNFQIDGGGWCRCTWVATHQSLPPGVDPDFANWMNELFEVEGKKSRESARRARDARLEVDFEAEYEQVRKDVEDARQRLDSLRKSPFVLTPDLLAHHFLMSDLRDLQRRLGVKGHRKKVDIAAQLISLESAADVLAGIRKQIHKDKISWAESEQRWEEERLRCIATELENLREQRTP